MSLKQQAAELAAQGVQPAEAAELLDVTPSYLCQLQEDNEFQRIYNSLVSANRVATHQQVTQIDSHYNNLEHSLLEAMVDHKDVVLASFIEKPAMMLNALKTFNTAKRRGMGETTNQLAKGEVVVLELPTFITEASQPVVRHNEQHEVIEVDGKPLVSRSSTALKSQLADMTKPSLPSPQSEAAPALAVSQAVSQLDTVNTGQLDIDSM